MIPGQRLLIGHSAEKSTFFFHPTGANNVTGCANRKPRAVEGVKDAIIIRPHSYREALPWPDKKTTEVRLGTIIQPTLTGPWGSMN
jgi:hypothetical protein